MQQEATRVVAVQPLATRPDFSDIIARIRKLAPEIDARALSTEKAKRVPAETMEALRDANVFRTMQPKRFGGYEYGPAELAQIGFELGRTCGSTGWCGTLAVCFGWMTAFFPLEAQQEVWDNADNLLAVSYTPSPTVEVVDGGLRVSGSWPWASSVDSAAWLILAALIPNREGPPAIAWCLVPIGDVTIDHESWNVSGLRGTGSKTVHITEPVFVPQHRVLPLSVVFSGQVPGLAVPDNAQARFGYPTFGPTALVAPIVGMAQGALDAFTENARDAKRMTRPGVFEKVADQPMTQSLIGRCAARLDAARTLMVTSLTEGQEVVRRGGTLEIEQRVRIRRNHGFAGRTAAEVASDIFTKSGASAADEKNRVQRFWRDATVAAQHASLDWDALSALYGTQQLGLQPQGVF
ncbi:acyl-CoA dehydrogenase family protein [Methylocella sp. CPCC 101449]|uniref:acyl-CoA dehydrogenase family protein n=1 Tax=Methylocella sp. CPCC 101449 TaxID=2987531 RepID=UPI002890F2D8|nr:acyl-CoA dehydrogenase family protein [Methylocella sp. CPCC 101449]MDT2022295.1 acyl-CoA dehydrogenase family protein [Methylocella sp. CPCC 101449]